MHSAFIALKRLLSLGIRNVSLPTDVIRVRMNKGYCFSGSSNP